MSIKQYCNKCGNNGADIKYHINYTQERIEYFGVGESKVMPLVIDKEYLELTCKCCGYKWKEDVLEPEEMRGI